MAVKIGNVLFLTQVLPYPLVGGAKIRAYYVLRYLSTKFNITLVSFVRDDDSVDHIRHLEQYCERIVTVPIKRSRWIDFLSVGRSAVSGHPSVIYRDDSSKMKRVIMDLMADKQFDIVHADQTAMAQFGLYACHLPRGENLRTILDQHNALYKVVGRQAQYLTGWQKWLWASEAAKIANYEAGLVRQFDWMFTVTKNDKDALLSLLPEEERASHSAKLTDVPICVEPADHRYIFQAGSTPKIVFLGTMYWPPNSEGVRWFGENVMPKIVQRLPDAKFIVIGKNPPEEVVVLSKNGSEIKDNVEITGFISNPESILETGSLFVVPLLAGGGMRVKILDAWLWGLPVVSTTIGAEGIEYIDGKNIIIADDPQDFANSVFEVLTDKNLAKMLSKNGRNWVEKKYDWKVVYQDIEKIYLELITNGQREVGSNNLVKNGVDFAA